MKKVVKSVLIVILICILTFSDSISFYMNYVYASTNEFEIIQAKSISIKSSNKNVIGKINKTNSLYDLNDGIEYYMSDWIEDKTIAKDIFNQEADIYSDSNEGIYCNQISLSGTTLVEDSIQINASRISSQDKTIVYSKHGDITVNSNQLCFNGILYAPNGKITINCSDCNINGMIICNTIDINAYSVELSGNEYISNLVQDLSYFNSYLFSSFDSNYNQEDNTIDIVLDTDEKAKVYASYDGNDFIEVKFSNNQRQISCDSFNRTIEIYSKGYLLGESVVSQIYGYKKYTNNDVCVELSNIDSDNDGICDGYEIRDLKTDPNNCDSDGDGFFDGFEVLYLNSNPLKFTCNSDSDNDGISDYMEQQNKSNPLNSDTDFDGYSDLNDKEVIIPNSNKTEYSKQIKFNLSKYDCTYKYISSDNEKITITINTLTNQIKRIANESEIELHFYDINGNNIAIVKEINGRYNIKSFAYDNNNKTIVNNNGQIYYLSYIDNKLNKIKIDNYTIVDSYECNEYATSTYQDSNQLTYYYDENGNIDRISLNDKDICLYEYDESGNIIKCEDKIAKNNYYINNNSNEMNYTCSNGLNILTNNRDSSISVNFNNNSIFNILRQNNEDEYIRIFDNNLIIKNKKIDGNTNIKIQYNNKSIMNNYYYENDNIMKMNNIIGDNYSFIYNKSKLISQINKNDEMNTNYFYDEYNQIIRVDDKEKNISEIYEYDENGNITCNKMYNYTLGKIGESIKPIKENNYLYDKSWKDLILEYNGDSISYNEVGCPLKYRDDLKFEWTDNKLLTKIDKKSLSEKITYLSDGNIDSITCNNIKIEYIWYNNILIGETVNGEDVWFIYDESNDLLGFKYKNEYYFYVYNGLGDVIGIADDKMNTIVEYSYDVWGKIIDSKGDSYLSSINPFRYRGYLYDQFSGLYWLNSRYYDPILGRFISPDIMLNYSNTYGCNLFSYCENNPILYTDKLGYGYFKNAWNKLVDTAAKATKIMTTTVKGAIKLMGSAVSIGVNSINDNYNKNSKIYINIHSYINGQALSPQCNFRMGFRYASENGCGWIATFNALVVLGDYVHPKDIIRYYENSAAIITGIFGVMPWGIRDYLQRRGHKIITYENPINTSDKLEHGKVSIFLFGNTKSCHYVALQYYHNYFTEFRIYNAYNIKPECMDVDKLSEYFKDDYSLYLINIYY